MDVPAGVSGIVPDAILALQPGQVLVINGKGRHWFQLPNGIRFELKEQKKA